MDQEKSVQQMQALGARLMNTPGLPAAMVAGARSMPKATTSKFNDERDAIIFDLQRQLEGERDKNRCLEDQFKYRVASFVKRETSTKNKIEALERRLNEGADTDEHMQRMDRIQNMHKTVVNSIESIQTNTTVILQNQEKDLMRSFRARLNEVTKELEAHRNKKGEHSTELQARHRRVVAELREAQELAQTFDKKNQELQKENFKLQEALSTRADDRQELLKELVTAKKDNAKLKAQIKGDALSARESHDEASRDRHDIATKDRPKRTMDASKLLQCRNQQYEKEVQYREAAAKLKRLVEAERKQLRALRQQQTDMLQQRTELEILLKQCLEDVVSEIQRHQAETPENQPDDGRPETGDGTTVQALSAQDRERVLELLFSQERVVQLLYSKTFATELGAGSEDTRVRSADSKPQPTDEFAWLGDIVPPEEL